MISFLLLLITLIPVEHSSTCFVFFSYSFKNVIQSICFCCQGNVSMVNFIHSNNNPEVIMIFWKIEMILFSKIFFDFTSLKWKYIGRTTRIVNDSWATQVTQICAILLYLKKKISHLAATFSNVYDMIGIFMSKTIATKNHFQISIISFIKCIIFYNKCNIFFFLFFSCLFLLKRKFFSCHFTIVAKTCNIIQFTSHQIGRFECDYDFINCTGIIIVCKIYGCIIEIDN